MPIFVWEEPSPRLRIVVLPDADLLRRLILEAGNEAYSMYSEPVLNYFAVVECEHKPNDAPLFGVRWREITEGHPNYGKLLKNHETRNAQTPRPARQAAQEPPAGR